PENKDVADHRLAPPLGTHRLGQVDEGDVVGQVVTRGRIVYGKTAQGRFDAYLGRAVRHTVRPRSLTSGQVAKADDIDPQIIQPFPGLEVAVGDVLLPMGPRSG